MNAEAAELAFWLTPLIIARVMRSAVEQTPTGRSEPQNAKMGAASREGNDDDGALAAAATVPARKLNLDLD